MRGSLGWVNAGRSLSLGTYARLLEAATRVAMSGGWSLDSRYAQRVVPVRLCSENHRPNEFLETHARQGVPRDAAAAAAGLPERGAGAGAPGGLRSGAHVVSSGLSGQPER